MVRFFILLNASMYNVKYTHIENNIYKIMVYEHRAKEKLSL